MTGATVIVKDDRLVAFVTPSDVSIDQVRESVLDILPPYMSPAVYVALAAFPTNANGKVRCERCLIHRLTRRRYTPWKSAKKWKRQPQSSRGNWRLSGRSC
ncbi:MAG: hypothetical protein EAZ92_00860 [Candidatus Kapaibacterium sp.]|nr:MAG: hypothetical protein EAZ92_00860 [Candidatus Kapabacteria bacterium]